MLDKRILSIPFLSPISSPSSRFPPSFSFIILTDSHNTPLFVFHYLTQHSRAQSLSISALLQPSLSLDFPTIISISIIAPIIAPLSLVFVVWHSLLVIYLLWWSLASLPQLPESTVIFTRWSSLSSSALVLLSVKQKIIFHYIIFLLLSFVYNANQPMNPKSYARWAQIFFLGPFNLWTNLIWPIYY